ncbi:MAG TPA: AAA family ATPase [Acidobacteriaceae bacterium]|nr:AAA family ATPase [Acidobacteriaceae bacterium]
MYQTTPRLRGRLLRRSSLCYILIMRQWMRERMRRRSKRGPNDSESTGKIGQELPAGQPAPLRPAYPMDAGRPANPEIANSESVPDAEGIESEPASAGAGPKQTTERAASVEEGSRGASTKVRPPRSQKPASRSASETRGEAAGSDAREDSGRKDAGLTPLAVPASEGKLVVETQPESPSVAPPEPAAVGPRSPKGYVVLAIGLPGSGKTTWFKRRGVMPLSSDMLRSILFDDISEQRYQGLVFSTLRSLLRARLIAKMPWNYVDATNLSPHERRQWIKMSRSFGYDVHAVFFDVPFEVCMERNSRRDRLVSEEVMRKMAERLRPPSFKEGFSKITMVRVKGAAPTQLEAGGEVESAAE